MKKDNFKIRPRLKKNISVKPLAKGVILKSVKKENPSVFFQFAPDTDATLAAALI